VSRRADIAFSLAFVGVVAIVVRGASAAPAPPPLQRSTPEQRQQLARQIASQEDGWRASAAADFPTDAWSQRDAFHNHEMGTIRDLAGAAKIPPEELFRAIDEDIHREGRSSNVNRSAEVVPLKPRPIFD
jgi:hypothetical protein